MKGHVIMKGDVMMTNDDHGIDDVMQRRPLLAVFFKGFGENHNNKKRRPLSGRVSAKNPQKTFTLQKFPPKSTQKNVFDLKS